ncbi:MAG: hypothetical protein EBR82_18525 [Caulobacteraceae bacterium]|nr:hypothetical protein [Caulobacteraceae bacterium]
MFVMSFLSRTQGTGEAQACDANSFPTAGEGPSGGLSRRQMQKRITKPLADPAFMGGILSQTRAAQ